MRPAKHHGKNKLACPCSLRRAPLRKALYLTYVNRILRTILNASLNVRTKYYYKVINQVKYTQVKIMSEYSGHYRMYKQVDYVKFMQGRGSNHTIKDYYIKVNLEDPNVFRVFFHADGVPNDYVLPLGEDVHCNVRWCPVDETKTSAECIKCTKTSINSYMWDFKVPGKEEEWSYVWVSLDKMIFTGYDPRTKLRCALYFKRVDESEEAKS